MPMAAPPAPADAAAAGYFIHCKSSGGSFTGFSSPPVDRFKSSSLFEMMAQEQEISRLTQPQERLIQAPAAAQEQRAVAPQTKQASVEERVNSILGACSPRDQFNDANSSDLKLSLKGKDGFSVSVHVHRHILVTNSRFFAARLSDRWSKQLHRSQAQSIEMCECEDVELYLQTIRLMYCTDLRRSLLKETVLRVLEILKVSDAIVFEAGVASCLEYLEAMPWAEDEEQKVMATISQLELTSPSVAAAKVLTRLNPPEPTPDRDAILARIIQSVTKATDEKARREMKSLISKLLQENPSLLNLSKESFYLSCHTCLDSLLQLFMQITSSSFREKHMEDRGALVSQISRQADNLHWLVDTLIQFQHANDFVRIWAERTELATLHAQLPTMYRYGVSRLTASLCVGIGKGSVWAPKEMRHLLLQIWLQPLVDDFGWMQRCCKSIDKAEVEEGISRTILTLPMQQQQSMLLAWFERFSISGDDCPNLHKAFEVWWRRRFVRPCLPAD